MQSFSSPSRYDLSNKAASLFLGLAILLAYGISLVNGFVWDDTQIIVNNMVNRDWSNLSKVLMGPDVIYTDDLASYYRPLNRLLYMIEYHLYGLNPFGYHLLNLLLHLGNVMLLFTFGNKIFANRNSAFIAALFFAVHPANAEAVNFISGRNNLFATFFVLTSLLLFHVGRQRSSLTLNLLSALSFLSGLFCKEIALMLVPVLYFYPFHIEDTKKSNYRERFILLLPFIVAALLYVIIRSAALSQIVTQPGTEGGLWSRLVMNLYIIPLYASMLVIPLGYKVYYSIPADIWPHLKWIVPFWAAFICFIYFLVRSGSKIALFALLWLICNYVPISNIIEIPSGAMAERFIYLPFIGVWLLVGFASDHFTARGVSPIKILSFATGVTLLLALFATMRSMEWKNDLTLFTSLVATNPESVQGHYNLGGWYREHGDMQKARYYWERTVHLQPNHSNALSQLGSVAFVEKRLNDAEGLYRRALASGKQNAEAHYNLALILEKTGRYAEALVHYTQFLKRVPPEYKTVVPEVTSRVVRLQEKVATP
ncbi:MAG: tetratricopeptide repeat protein [Desulfuromonadaceae bacterium]|nr:tetratricopeptide repeat protein [Desulfuromonadaceae bacterium]